MESFCVHWDFSKGFTFDAKDNYFDDNELYFTHDYHWNQINIIHNNELKNIKLKKCANNNYNIKSVQRSIHKKIF